MKKLALLLFSSEPNSCESKFFIDINNIPIDIDILDFHYKNNLESNLIFKDTSYQTNNVYSVSSTQKSTASAIEYAFSIGYEYVFYSHHDIFNLTNDAFEQILDICKSNKLKDFGLVGFNIYHDKEINYWNEDINKLSTTSHSFLQPGNGWYSTSPISSVNYKKFPLNHAFSVEIPHWACCLLNSVSYNKINHVPIADFNLCLDDLAYDFLKNDIHNICVPWICFAHQQSISVIFGREYKSPLNKKEAPKIRKAHINWFKKWGFPVNQFYMIKISKFKIINHILEIYREFIRNKLPTRFQNSYIINYIKTKGLNEDIVLEGLLNKYFEFNPCNGPLEEYPHIKNENVKLSNFQKFEKI